MTSLLRPPKLAMGVAASVMAILVLAPVASFAEPSGAGMITPIAAANLSSLDLLARAPAQTRQHPENVAAASARYPFSETNGLDLSHGWYFGKPTRGRSRVGFVWENPQEQSSLSTIHLSAKGLRLERRF